MVSLRSFVALFAGALLVLLVASDSFAVRYRYHYTTEKGESLFADDLQSVPEKYRGQAMIVSTDDVDEKVQQAVEQERTQSAAAAQAVVQQRAEQVATAQVQEAKEQRMHIAWTIGIALAFIVALVVPGMIEALKEHEQTVAGVRLALTVLFFGYLAFAHGKDVLRLFGTAGATVTGWEKRSADQGRKTAQFYKDLEKMMEQAEAVQRDQAAQEKGIEERP